MRWTSLGRALVVNAAGVSAAVALVAAPGSGSGMAAAETTQTVQIQVLSINDFHGSVAAVPEEGVPGAAVVAGAVEALREQYSHTIVVGAGDLYGASAVASDVAQDRPTIAALNELGLEVSALGNHELDFGLRDLTERVLAPHDPLENPCGGAQWEYLAANVAYVDGDETLLPPTWTTTVGGVEVGFVGVLTRDIEDLVPAQVLDQLEVTDLADAANEHATALREDGADLVILLAHSGAVSEQLEDAVDPEYSFGRLLADLDPAVDAVFSGHSHKVYDHHIEVPAWEDEDRPVTWRPAASAGINTTHLNQVVFHVDGSGTVTEVETAIIPLPGDYEPDPKVAELVDAAAERASTRGGGLLADHLSTWYRVTADVTTATGAGPSC